MWALSWITEGIQEFVAAPREGFLDHCTKDELVRLADIYELDLSDIGEKFRKEKIKSASICGWERGSWPTLSNAIIGFTKKFDFWATERDNFVADVVWKRNKNGETTRWWTLLYTKVFQSLMWICQQKRGWHWVMQQDIDSHSNRMAENQKKSRPQHNSSNVAGS